MLTRFLRRIAYLVRQRRLEQDLAEEMAFHRDELARRGEGRFGNVALAREDARAVWLAPWIESVLQDLRIGARLLRRSPGVTVVAITTMALGIGANTAVYTFVDAALFRPLQVAAPERLVFFAEKTRFGLNGQNVTFDEYEYLRDHTRTLAGLAAQVPASATDGHGACLVVGVARDIVMSRRDRSAGPAIFLPYTLAGPVELGQADVFVRTRGTAVGMTADFRRVVKSVEPNLALLDLEPLSNELDRSLDPERTTAALAGVCGVLALVLSAIGLYGTLSQAIGRRTREIGVRLSLGATRSGVVRMVLKESAAIVGVGAALGIPLTVVSARGLSALLFGVGAIDPVALAPAIALVFSVALAAAYVPARRAARVDPVIALRAD